MARLRITCAKTSAPPEVAGLVTPRTAQVILRRAISGRMMINTKAISISQYVGEVDGAATIRKHRLPGDSKPGNDFCVDPFRVFDPLTSEHVTQAALPEMTD